MATRTHHTSKFHGPPASTYEALVRALPPRPLHDKTDYDNAVAMIGRLVGYQLNPDQEDYLEALDTFVQKYEAEHDETQVSARVSGVDLLKALLAEHEMSGADLARLLGGSRSLGPMILRGERSVTVEHARVLGEHFKLDFAAFLR